MTGRRWPAIAVTAALVTAVLAGCGSTRASGTGQPATPATPSLATSASYPDGTWAVLVMGGAAAQHNNFWQVFTRPAGKQAAWRLATPLGVASNGGIAVAATGGPSLVAAVLPSQDLHFSPLSRSTDGGAKWAADGLLDVPLAAMPSALAAAPGGGLIALTRRRHGRGGLPPRRPLGPAGHRALGGQFAGRPELRADQPHRGRPTPLPGPRCWPGPAPGRPRGHLRARGGRRLGGGRAGSARGPGRRPVAVLQLARSGTADVALLQVGAGRTASLLGAWSTGDGSGWQLSAPYRLAGAQPRSAAVAGRALGVLLRSAHGTTGRAVTVTGPGAAWQALPALPAGTAALPAGAMTLAAGPAGGFQLLTGRLSGLSVWAAGASGWTRSQVIKVSIPYGSSS